jgi:RHS repeat-associated protein
VLDQAGSEGAAASDFEDWWSGASRDYLPSGRPKAPGPSAKDHLDQLKRQLTSPLVDRDGNPTYVSYDPEPWAGSWQRSVPLDPGDATRHVGPSAITDSAGATTRFKYDAIGNLTSVTDANGNTTTYAYDANGRLVKETLALGQTTTYAYNDAANSITITDPKGQTTTLTYSETGRLVSIKRPSDALASNVTLTYDLNGRLTGWDDGTMSETYTWDGAGRKLSQNINYGSISLGSQYTYNTSGLRSTLTGPDGITYTYSYDKSNQPLRIDIPGVGSLGLQDFHTGLPAEIDYPGGTKLLASFTSFFELAGTQLVDTSQQVRTSAQYSLNADRMVTSKTVDSVTTSYAYDAGQRVASASGGSETFVYDAAGNLLGPGSPMAPWSYDANERLLSTGSVSYTYDGNGNVASKTSGGVTTSYAYDTANRLVQVKDGGGNVTASYGYDPFDRRTWKATGGATTYYYYEDEGLAAEQVGSTIQAAYAYLPASGHGTNPLFLKTGGNYYYYQNDHLGTPQRLSDSTGNVVWAADYTTYGNATVRPTSTVTNNLRFPGQYYDAETGLHYNHRRYYDPAIGRYLTPDPIGISGGLNAYQYARGNPTNWIDPTGEGYWGLALFALFVIIVICSYVQYKNPAGGPCGCISIYNTATYKPPPPKPPKVKK